MYAMVKNVAKPPRISRGKVEPRSDIRNHRSSGPPPGGPAEEVLVLSATCPDIVLLKFNNL
jgi:hypothetical protein